MVTETTLQLLDEYGKPVTDFTYKHPITEMNRLFMQMLLHIHFKYNPKGSVQVLNTRVPNPVILPKTIKHESDLF